MNGDRVSERTLWLGVLLPILAWSFDEGISLVVDAYTCMSSGGFLAAGVARTLLVVLGVVALAIIAWAMMLAQRWRVREADAGDALPQVRRLFLANFALVVAALSGFGVVLRLFSALTTGACW